MNIDFKNILAGVGGVGVLVTVAILGMFSSADYNSDISTDSFSTTNSSEDFISGEFADDSQECGLLYTYDGYNGQKFSLDINDIKHLAFDENDNMYVPETGKIIVFNKDGSYKKTLYFDAGFIWDLVAFENHLYFLQDISDWRGSKVFLEKYEIEPKFKFVKQVDIKGNTYLALNQSGRYVYTSTWLSSTIHKTKIDDLNSIGAIQAKDIYVQDIFFDNTNNLLYVLDENDHSVKVYNTNDSLLYSFGKDGGPGIKLEGAISITVDNTGSNLYVAESTGKIKKFTKDANGNMKYVGFIEIFSESEIKENEIKSVELDQDGNLYVVHSHFELNKANDYVVIKKYTPPCAKITIKKETNQKTNTTFNFNADFYGANTPNFSLKSGSSVSYNSFNLTNSITEISDKAFKLESAKCFDKNGKEYGILSGQTLSIKLETFKDITCTFKNSCKGILSPGQICGESLEPQKDLINP